MDSDMEQDEMIVDWIIEKEAVNDRLNSADCFINEQCFLHAVHRGDCKTVIDKLRLGTSVEAENAVLSNDPEFKTPLQIAASKGYADIVQILLDHGANVYAINRYGNTALDLAAKNGHYHCLKTLLKAGDNNSISTVILCKEEAFKMLAYSAFSLASKHKHRNCKQELLKYGANRPEIDMRGESFQEVVAIKASYKYRDFLTNNGHSITLSICWCLISDISFTGSLGNNGICNGILDVYEAWGVDFEDYDVEIFKLFVLEGYYFDDVIPTGFPTLYHLGSEYYNSKIAAILIASFNNTVIKKTLFDMNLIKYLLRIYGKFETLEFVLKCVLWVPHLNSLVAFSVRNELPEKNLSDTDMENFVLPPNATFALECIHSCMYVSIYDREQELADLEHMWSDIVSAVPRYGQYPLTPSLINLINERISDEIDQLKLLTQAKMSANHQSFVQSLYLRQLCSLKKYLWCEKIAFNPPSLQQCCRYSVLKCLGPLNVKNIRKLPLPYQIQSYLLFQ